jgi:glutathione synthase/RimK-type ligase-like ATP-grasp enzyme
MAEAKQTTDHDEIRRWAEERGGKPAVVKSTHDKNGGGILRLEFPGAPHPHDENLEEISWDEFFEKFDRQKLAFLYQDKTADGKVSRFFKFVSRS